MPQAKPKPGRKPTALAPPPAIPLDLLVRAFRTVAGQSQEISFFNGPGPAEIQIKGSTVEADGKWKNFNRLVIGSGTAAPLVFDVIPDNDAVIKFETNDQNTKSTLSVECQIRCVIAQPGDIEFKITIEKEKKKVKYTRVRVQGPFAIPTGSPPPNDSRTYFDLYPSPQAGVNPVPSIVAHDKAAPYRIPFATNGFRSRMAEVPLGIEFQSPAPANNYFNLFFETICPQQNQCVYGIVFTTLRPDRSNNTERLVPLFTVPGSGRVGLRISTSQMPNGWRITQRASRLLSAKSKQQDPAKWHVTLGEIPASSAYSLWNHYVEGYWRALNTVRGGSPVSLLPKLDSPPNNAPWEAFFVISDPTAHDDPNYALGNAGANEVSVFGRTIEPATHYQAQLMLGQVMTHNNRPLVLRSQLGKALVVDDTVPEPRLTLTAPDVSTAVHGNDIGDRTIRLGALDITVATQAPAGNNQFQSTYEMQFRQTLFVEAKPKIILERITPGGQDDLPGEEFVAQGEGLVIAADESVDPCVVLPTGGGAPPHPQINTTAFNACVESGFRRKRPIVIALPETAAGPNDRLFLEGTETAKDERSQTVELNLLNQTQGLGGAQSPDQSHVIVLDSNPFLVAEVQFTAFSKQVGVTGSTIASWTNAGIEGAGWQLRQSGEGPAEIILPSQGIGEEMERGYPHNLQTGAVGPGHTIATDSLVDFRLAPPARLAINVGEREQRFIEAPWNLRRVLGFAGQRTPGARIRHLQFELLYGLSCDVRTPFLRLAEITALLGEVPARLGVDPRWMPMTAENIRSNGTRYQESRFDWSRLYRRYLSRLAILEPWDSHVKESLVLSDDVQCRIRKVKQVQGNITIPEAELADPVDPTKPAGPLKGGVTWGFESKNVYKAVMRPEGQNPLSTSASVSDLYFSSLGGYGRLVAGFDKDRSKIYDDVSLGRTYSYKLERIGRIACWWNRAKHVIVYERTVVPSRQFNSKQPRHGGRPIVRKVREYIKILDEKRNYPDGTTELSQSERAILEKRRGFVAACSFPPGAEIPVDSSWGTDVLDIGWKVPLWNAAEGAANPEVYPKPVISPHLFSDVGGVSQSIPVVIDEPQNVYFYTDTREETSGDPNEWPPIKGVDYVDCPLPRPQNDFEDGNTQQTTPADTAIPAGFGPCTFKLEPPAVPADLVAARAGKPLSAVLESVTIVRALLKEAEAVAAPGAIGKKFEDALNLGKQLKSPLADTLNRIPNEGVVVPQSLAQLVQDVEQSFNGGAFKGFFDEVDRRCADINAEINNLENLIRKRERELFAGLEAQLVKLVEDRRRAFLQDIQDVLTSTESIAVPATKLEERRKQFLVALDQNIVALQNALLLLRLSPGLLQKSVERAAGGAARLIKESEAEIIGILTRIDQYAVTLTAQQLQELKGLTSELIRKVESLFGALDAGVSRSLEAWLPDPAVYVIEKYLADANANPLRKLILDWKNSLTTNILQASVLSQAAARQALAVETSWVAVIRDKVTLLAGEATDHVGAWRDELVGDIAVKPAFHIENQLAGLRRYVQGVTAIDVNFSLLRDLVTNMLETEIPGAQSYTQNLRKTLAPLRDKLEKQVSDAAQPAKGLLQFTRGAANRLCDQVSDRQALKNRLLAALASSTEAKAIAQAIRQTIDGFHTDVNQYADAAMGLFQQNAAWPQLQDVYAAGNTALGVVRAFGKPPVVPNMSFERPALAYFYKELNDRVDLTPVLSTVAKAAAVADALKPLGISLPTLGMVEKLVPPDLKNFDLSKIFPDFAGLNLKHLFPNLKMPSAANDRVKISHGADPQSRRAWIDVVVDFPMDRPATLFSIGPVSIRIVNARFDAVARVEAGLGNEPPKRSVRGLIIGDWELTLGGQTIVIFRRTEMRFDESGKLRFSLDPRNLEMPGILSFLQDFMKRFSDSSSGLTIGFAPGGVQAVLNLPIPDLQVGAFGLSNLRLGALLRITVVGDDGFAIAVGFNVGRKLAPFALTIFILGGGGYLEVETKYVPAKKQITCSVELGITACASLAIALGPIKGGVYVYFGITAQFRSGQGGGLTIGVMFLIRGEVSILGIVEACVSLLLEAKYSSGRLIGHGNLSIKIKICWCFTLEVSEDVTYELAGGGGGTSQLENPELQGLLAFNRPALSPADPMTDVAPIIPAPPTQRYVELAAKYIDLLT